MFKKARMPSIRAIDIRDYVSTGIRDYIIRIGVTWIGKMTSPYTAIHFMAEQLGQPVSPGFVGLYSRLCRSYRFRQATKSCD